MDIPQVVKRGPQRDIKLPSLPHALIKLLEAAQSDTVPVAHFAKLVGADPALALQVLRLANSPLFNQRKRVDSLAQATVLLGIGTIRNLALMISVVETFSTLKKDRDDFSISSFWWHSIASGFVAQCLAGEIGHKPAEDAFMAGLLHDIGQLMFLAAEPSALTKIVQGGSDGHTLLNAERSVFGCDHALFGADALERWKMHPLLCDAVRYHHHPVEEIRNAFPLVRIVAAANYVSHALCNPSDESRKTACFMLEVLLGLPSETFEVIKKVVSRETEAMAGLLGITLDARGKCAISGGYGEEREKKDAVRKKIIDHSLLIGVIDAFLSARSVEELCESAIKSLGIHFDFGSMFLAFSKGEGLLQGFYALGSRDDLIASQIRIPFGPGSLWNHAFVGRAPVHIEDPSMNAGIGLVERQLVTFLGGEYLAIPLLHGEDQVGVIVAEIPFAEWGPMKGSFSQIMLIARHLAASLARHNERERRTIWLREELSKRTKELENAHAKIVRAERLMAAETMARKVAHEVNNPLGIMKNYLAILKQKVSAEDASGPVSVLEGEIDRIRRIVDQLRNFSGPPKDLAGRGAGDVAKVVEDLRLLWEEHLAGKGIELDISLERGLPLVTLSDDGIRQVLINLVKNAEEALGGPGRIRISASSAGIPGNEVVIEVANTGPSISPEVEARIFEPFVTTKGGENAGLGLSVCHGIIRSANGVISVVNREGWGACFEIRLPALLQKC